MSEERDGNLIEMALGDLDAAIAEFEYGNFRSAERLASSAKSLAANCKEIARLCDRVLEAIASVGDTHYYLSEDFLELQAKLLPEQDKED